MGLFSAKIKDEGENLKADVMNNVLPHLENSIKSHINAEKQKVVASILGHMQASLPAHLQPQAPAPAQPQIMPQSAPFTALSALQPNSDNSNSAALQHVIGLMTPHLNESVKRIVDQEKTALVGNVVQKIQSSLDNQQSSHI